MITKRIIPCLDVRDGRVVKGTNFEGLKDVDDPVELAKYYNNSLADELVFYDITASYEDRSLFVNVLKNVAKEIFIPLTVGGGINSIKDFDIVLKSGADKVSINSGTIKNPNLIKEAAEKYGNQCVVLSIDIKRVNGRYSVFAKGGREDTGIDAIKWAINGEKNGAGELVINSIDTDGVKNGFDIELLKEIADNVSIPLIASGGAGNMEHFKDVFAVKGVDAGLAASIFHYKEIDIKDLKEYLSKNNINVRL
ncbi:imidazole glycerol phosphate synthase subunit HisF [Brachyspira innocens]|uniref:imidazole glycerol phosphate synthase subunit HisF n=1 Tax=Brachyspira innocens TaxID=13264 RepID=UPI0026F16577|nr:imidazole glycerol phosphate synthase subunit HisF [Brachyspira innocens]